MQLSFFSRCLLDSRIRIEGLTYEDRGAGSHFVSAVRPCLFEDVSESARVRVRNPEIGVLRMLRFSLLCQTLGGATWTFAIYIPA